jgi:hypothetical protein
MVKLRTFTEEVFTNVDGEYSYFYTQHKGMLQKLLLRQMIAMEMSFKIVTD